MKKALAVPNIAPVHEQIEQARIVPFDSSTEMAVIDESPAPLLEVAVVEAVCKSIVKSYFAPFQQTKWVFNFAVISPDKYTGQKLQMFVRLGTRWKTPPPGSKLFKAACIAKGSRLVKGDRITHAMFQHCVFRCRLKQVGEGAARYSVIENLLERLTGI